MMSTNVKKALNSKVEKMSGGSQAKTIFNNLLALVDELEKLEGQELMQDAPEDAMGQQLEEMKGCDTMKQEEQTDRPVEEVEEIAKGIEQTSSEGSTASDDAGERDMGNATDTMDENVQMLAKALLQMAGKSVEAKKSVAPKNNDLTTAINTLTTVVKSLATQQNEQATAIESILKGLGVAEQIEKSAPTKKVEKQELTSSKELNSILEYVAKSIETQQKGESVPTHQPGHFNQNEQARKSIAGWLPKAVK